MVLAKRGEQVYTRPNSEMKLSDKQQLLLIYLCCQLKVHIVKKIILLEGKWMLCKG